MDTNQMAILAGITSTVIFASSNIPMILKAYKTKDLQSYSLANLVLSNVGNCFHWVYIASLPFGPIWLLHTFYTFTAALMLYGYFRFRWYQRSTKM